MILGKNAMILEKNSAIFNKIGKVYLLSSDFSANWECSRSIGNFFSQMGKKLVPETAKPDPVLYKEKALGLQNLNLLDWLPQSQCQSPRQWPVVS